MEWKRIGAWGGLVGLLCVAGVFAQQGQPAGDGSSAGASSAGAAVPRLVKFSGAVRDTRGEPLGSVAVRLTFSVYEEPTGGAALWVESQVAQLDEQGHYTVLLGATRADGLPVELFPAGKARWLGVQVEGRDEEPRALLVSVPYALKAEDAAKLGGRTASDFVLAEQLKDEVRTQVEAQKPTATNSMEMLIPGQPIRPAFTAGPTTITCATSGNCMAVTQSGAGRALSALATSSTESVLVQQSGTGYGLRALAPSNTALFGQVTGASGTTYGVRGQTPSTTGAGVLGSSTAATGTAYGVRGNSVSSGGAGVAGFNTSATGMAFGILAQASSTEGAALYGRALAGTGGTIGLWGDVDSTSGTGVVGRATATSGATNGIYAEANSAAGTALIVDNTKGGKLVSARANGTEKFAVDGSGNVSASGGVTATSFTGSGSGLTNLNADTLDGVHASAFATLAANTFVGYQSITGYLTASGVVTAASVHGAATAANGQTTGVYGQTESTTGSGVNGWASATSGDVSGVSGESDSTNGKGVFGIASATSGPAHGVFGITSSTGGVGVFGLASATSGNTIGVQAGSASPNGTGVYASADATTGSANGVYGQTASTGGTGVYGQANATSGFARGVVGATNSANGVGVMGLAQAAGGVAGVFTNATGGGDILGGWNSGGQVFRVDNTGTVTATAFVGNGSGLTNLPGGGGVATDLNCTGCVSASEVSFNYAGSSSQGGAATSALSATSATTAATATNASNLGGVAAANYARTDVANTFNGNQTINGGIQAGPGLTRTPLAYGYFYSDGSKSVGSSNISCTWNALSTRYECSVTNESLHYALYIYSVIPTGGPPLIPATNSVGGKVLISFYNLTGTAVQSTYGFSLSIFKP